MSALRFSSRRHMALGIFALVILVGGFGGWAATTRLAGAIVAPGRVEVDQNRQVVQHLNGGVVGEILVREGDVVEPGAVLLRLDANLLETELAVARARLAEITARRALLEAERDDLGAVAFPAAFLELAKTDPAHGELIESQKRLFAARNASRAATIGQLNERRAQLAAQVDGIEAQTQAIAAQLALLQSEIADQVTLREKGLGQASRLLALQREEARIFGVLGELKASRAENAGRAIEIGLEITKLETRRREEAITQLRDLQSTEAETTERQISLSAQIAQMDVTAPVGGVVYGMQVFARRAVVRPADPILYIVPQDRPLVISARIQAIHVDEVSVGQPVSLVFSTFDSRNLPEITGHVVRVSADAFTDDTTGLAFYTAEILPDDGEIAKLGDVQILPGMPVESFLRTADRTPVDYLLKPLARYFYRAFRES